MKYLTLMLLLIPFVVNADVQINQQQQFAHIPFDLNDTDREIYVGSIDLNTNVQDGWQTATVNAVLRMVCWAVPEEIVNIEPQGKLELSHIDSDETCTLTDVNGDARTVDKWGVRFSEIREDEGFGNTCTFDASIWCAGP